jgi:hypothetical protein
VSTPPCPSCGARLTLYPDSCLVLFMRLDRRAQPLPRQGGDEA